VGAALASRAQVASQGEIMRLFEDNTLVAECRVSDPKTGLRFTHIELDARDVCDLRTLTGDQIASWLEVWACGFNLSSEQARDARFRDNQIRACVDLVMGIERAVAARYGDGHASVDDVRRVHREFQARVHDAVRVYCAGVLQIDVLG
jgi:hypothetical protein